MKASIFELLVVGFGMIMLLVYGVCRWLKTQYTKSTSYVANTKAYKAVSGYTSAAVYSSMDDANAYLASRRLVTIDNVSDVATQLHATLKAAKPTTTIQ